jgi:hypothetical protein
VPDADAAGSEQGPHEVAPRLQVRRVPIRREALQMLGLSQYEQDRRAPSQLSQPSMPPPGAARDGAASLGICRATLHTRPSCHHLFARIPMTNTVMSLRSTAAVYRPGKTFTHRHSFRTSL